jgi:Ca2+-binding RTX toxin-like protein
MPDVTVTGANHTIISIPIASAANAALAQMAMGIVNNEILKGLVTPYDYSGFGPLRPPSGPSSLDLTGFSRTPVSVPAGTTSVFDPGGSTIYGGQASQQLMVAGEAGFTYFANAGAGTVIAGGGNNFIEIGSGSGSHMILTGVGNDTIDALYGNDTISAGSGHNRIVLGWGNDSVNVTGADTIQAGWGAATISVAKGATAVVYGDGGKMDFVDGGSASTVFGGSGAATLQAGSGHDFFYAGSGAETFRFVDGSAGGSTEISNFIVGKDFVDLDGYGPNAAANALKNVTVSHGSLTMTLADHTTITFEGITHLTTSSFV